MEIPGSEESSVKSTLVIDDLQSRDLKRIEDVDQSCKNKHYLKMVVVSTTILKFEAKLIL